MSTTDIRAAFEAWHEKRFGWKPNHRVSGSGNYHDGNAQGRWMTWQAALEIDPSTGVSAKMPPDASDNDLLRIIKEGPEWKHFGMSNEESALLGIRACRAALAATAAPVVAEPLTTENIACMGFDTFRILQGMEPHTYTAQQIAETILARRK